MISASTVKNEKGGVSLDPSKHDVKGYLKDMDTRNKQVVESKKKKLSDETQERTKYHYNGIFGIHTYSISAKTPYFDWDEVFGGQRGVNQK